MRKRHSVMTSVTGENSAGMGDGKCCGSGDRSCHAVAGDAIHGGGVEGEESRAKFVLCASGQNDNFPERGKSSNLFWGRDL